MAKHYLHIFPILLFLMTNDGILHAKIINPSFEPNQVDRETKVLQKLKGWKTTLGNVELIAQDVFTSSDGNQTLDLNEDQIKCFTIGCIIIPKQLRDVVFIAVTADEKFRTFEKSRGNDPMKRPMHFIQKDLLYCKYTL